MSASVLACAAIACQSPPGSLASAILEVSVSVEGRSDPSGVTVTVGDRYQVVGADGIALFEGVAPNEPLRVHAAIDHGEFEGYLTLEPGEHRQVGVHVEGVAGVVTIRELRAGSRWGAVVAGEFEDLVVTAEDSAGGELVYSWEVTNGWRLTSFGRIADLSVPSTEGATATVTVTVMNAIGDSATASAELVAVDCYGDGPRLGCALRQWSALHPVIVNASEIDEPLTDVPILLTLEPDRIDYADATGEGVDVRVVTKSFDSILDHEIDRWQVGGTSHVWVRLPELRPGEDVQLWLFYGNPNAVDHEDSGGVWRDAFRAVWHGDVSGNLLVDSTDEHNDATSPLADWSDRLVSGLVGRGVVLDGHPGGEGGAPPTTYFEIDPLGASLDLVDAFTLEAVVQIDADWPEVDWTLVQKGPEGGHERFSLGLSSQQQVLGCRVFPEASGAPIRNDDPPEVHPGAAAEVPLGSYTYLACSYDGDTLAAYVDGERVQSLPIIEGGPLATSAADVLTIGRSFDDSRFGGVLDELRISSVARSDTWIRAQQLTLEGALVSIGERR